MSGRNRIVNRAINLNPHRLNPRLKPSHWKQVSRNSSSQKSLEYFTLVEDVRENKQLEDLLKRIDPSDRSVYVQEGRSVTLPCTDPNVAEAGPMASPHYQWKNSHGESFSPFRVKIAKDGVLTLPRVDAKDSNSYTCTKKSGDQKLKMRPYTVYVYHPIRPVKHYKVRYLIGKCKDLSAVDIRDIQERATRNLLCNGETDTCDYHISAGCHHDGADGVDYHQIEITKELHKFKAPSCGPKCVLTFMLTELNNHDKEIERILKDVKTLSGHPFLVEDYSSAEEYRCHDGYKILASLLCRTSSVRDAGQCKACPLGSYQDEYGRAGCKSCPSDFSTRLAASMTMDDCYYIGPPPTTLTSITRKPFSNEQKRWILLSPLGLIPIFSLSIACIIGCKVGHKIRKKMDEKNMLKRCHYATAEGLILPHRCAAKINVWKYRHDRKPQRPSRVPPMARASIIRMDGLTVPSSA
ncbi:hypothetical protein CAPTEDRAFT_209819 [Capitella teleta]|uniref:Ig-like domain-containing protein n=1 Tax=Capitella teleta TaxID=283909 RepID=R7T448_CAPTE|nr:hypothetical protein CAPTEDRAFT_209819 [Capitella teleta]|eukprot:ELT87613.1 hypothetical protein CAPTEDRAFT_209819 [Capitella teleta]